MRYRGLDAVSASSKKMVQAVPDTIMYTRGILQVRDTVVTNIKHACATHSVLQVPAMCALSVQRIPFCKSPQCTPFHVQRIPFCKSPQCVPFCAQVSRAMGDDDDERHLRNDGKLGDFIVHARAAVARRRDAPGPIPAQALRTRRQSTNARNACAHRARSRTSQAARRCGPRAGRKRAGRAEGLHAC